jgi:hypothetical protein
MAESSALADMVLLNRRSAGEPKKHARTWLTRFLERILLRAARLLLRLLVLRLLDERLHLFLATDGDQKRGTKKTM